MYSLAIGSDQTSAPTPSLDPQPMKDWTPNSTYGGHAFGLGAFPNFLAKRNTILPWIAEYSPYSLVTPGDPPIYLAYSSPPALGQNEKDPTHTSNFGLKLQQHCQQFGVPCELVYPNAPNVQHATMKDYLIEKLNAPKP